MKRLQNLRAAETEVKRMERQHMSEVKDAAKKVTHEFGPFYDKNSKVLILGSIPSPKSREQGFYYGHPRNRFWPVLAALFDENVPQTVPERKNFLKRHGIALWDVLASCDIKGADDGSIRNPEANDMRLVTGESDVRAIFTTGGKAAKLYEKLCEPVCGIKAVGLLSTSPANCRYSLDKLTEEYRKILKYL